MSLEVYESASAMEPMFPEHGPELEQLAVDLIRSSGRLGSSLHQLTASGVATLVRSMNSYYSNLIEGHTTHPLEIERALQKDFSKDPGRRALQLESSAHIEVQNCVKKRLPLKPRICSSEFLCWMHKEFYVRLPAEFRIVKTKSGREDVVKPGELRNCEVEVGKHIAPASTALPKFLSRFESTYDPINLGPIQQIIAAAASHHRLAWIHPFLDGNGRVTRLFTDTYFSVIELDSNGLWSASRGLARRKGDYLDALSAADAKRWNDYDGRGNLSTKALGDFCRFFLELCLDQIKFMTSLLDLGTMENRLVQFGERFAYQEKLPFQISILLRDCFLRGEISRGEAAILLQKPERTTRRYIHLLLTKKIISSEGPGKPLRLGFPMNVVGYYFPKLFPPGIENDLNSAPFPN